MKKSLYEESKSSLFSLFKQIFLVSLGFIIILLITKGNPSPLILSATVIIGILLVSFTKNE